MFLYLHLRRADWTLPVGLLAMFPLLNFKAWESRHYLYLVPFMGAGMAEGLAFLHAATWGFVLACALSVALAAVELVQGIRRERSDLSVDSVSAAAVLAGYGAPAGSVVIARKPHVCYYAGLECEGFPDADGLAELRHAVAALAARRPPEAKVFLFYGFVERELRPALAALHGRELDLPWLRRIGTGKENRKWVLYEVVREALGASDAG